VQIFLCWRDSALEAQDFATDVGVISAKMNKIIPRESWHAVTLHIHDEGFVTKLATSEALRANLKAGLSSRYSTHSALYYIITHTNIFFSIRDILLFQGIATPVLLSEGSINVNCESSAMQIVGGLVQHQVTYREARCL